LKHHPRILYCSVTGTAIRAEVPPSHCGGILGSSDCRRSARQ
jgi:hypothetical protein